MKREDLKKLLGESATDEVINGIMKLHGDDIEAHKVKVTEVETARDQFKTQLDAANEQIAGFKGMKTQEEVDAAVAEYKTKYEQAEQEHAAQLVGMQFDKDFDAALTGAKVKYPNEIKARLQLDALKDSNGKFIAERFNEQIGKLKTDAVDLFESDNPNPRLVSKTNNTTVVGDPVTNAARRAAGLPEAPTK